MVTERFEPTDGGTLLERHLQTFLSENLHLLAMGNLRLIGVEHPVPFGRIDVLAQDGLGRYLVVEAKRDTATRDAIGQLQSYIGAMRQEKPGAVVTGVLVAADLDAGAKAALAVTQDIAFVKYRLRFEFEVGPSPSPQQTSSYFARPEGTLPHELEYCPACRRMTNVLLVGGARLCSSCRKPRTSR